MPGISFPIKISFYGFRNRRKIQGWVPEFFGRAGGFSKGSALGRRRRRRLGGVAGGTQACSYSPRGSKGFNPWRSRERSANFETESQNCPTELRQFLVTLSDAKIRIYFGTAKGGGKNWLGTPFRSQNLRLVHQLKIVSWKESCARMPGPKSLWIEGTV